MNIGWIFSRSCLQVSSYLNPNKVALVFENNRFTYGELNERINRLANSFIELGLKKSERVAILARNCTEWVVALFGIAKAGGVVVPVNFAFKPPEIEYIAKDSGCNYFVVDEGLISNIEPVKNEMHNVREFISISGEQIKGYINFRKLEETGKADEPNVAVDLGDMCLLPYTSGTTGRPKGVGRTHGNIMWDAIGNIFDVGITEDDVYLSIPSFSWVAGWCHYFMGILWVGGKVVLNPTGGLKIDNLLEIIERERVTRVFLVPTVIKRLLDFPDFKKYDIGSLKMITTAAEPVPVDLINRMVDLLPNVSLIQLYGLTEFSCWATVMKRQYVQDKGRSGSCGKPGWNIHLRIVDDMGNDVPPGTEGEIIVRGPMMMKDYWNNSKATEETIKDGWLYTGDLGIYDKDGFVYMTARKKDMIISGGLNVYPAEIEAVISKNPKVAEVAVIGILDPKWGEAGKALILPKPGEIISHEELLELCEKNLANYKIPKYFEFIKEPLPRTASGKIKKFELRERENIKTEEKVKN